MDRELAIIGAGLSGLVCALYLAKRGFNIALFEARSCEMLQEKKSPGQGNRSMSMDLSARGLFALRELDMAERALAFAVPMRRKIFHGIDGTLTHIPYGRHDEEYIHTVSREYLYALLLEACLSNKNIFFNYDMELVDVDLSRSVLRLYDKKKQQYDERESSVIIGADGVHSRARQCLERHTGLSFEISHFKQAYKGFSIPEKFAQKLEYEAMHLWSRDRFMLVAQPNPDRSFSLALLMPAEGSPVSFASLSNETLLKAFFKQYFGDALPLMPVLSDEYNNNPVGFLSTVRGPTWACEGKLALIGDAAHCMVPFFGQGVNCCFEDCTVLNQCLAEANDHWPLALSLYNERRVKNGAAIAALSHDNYPELHQSRVMERVLLKKQIDLLLNKKYGDNYIGYQQLVSFYRVPYVYAMACKKLQEPLLDALSKDIDTVTQLDWQQVDVLLGLYRKQIASLPGVAHGF